MQARAPLPWFVFGFIALIGVNSLGVVPVEAKQVLVPATTFLLTVALAAMGLETDIGSCAPADCGRWRSAPHPGCSFPGSASRWSNWCIDPA